MSTHRLIAACLATVAALLPSVASAHGTVTGIADVWQDYGVAIFLSLVVLVGAGVLLWVLLAPLPIEPADEPMASGPSSDLDKSRSVDHKDRRAT